MYVASIMGGQFESNVFAVCEEGHNCVLIDCSSKKLSDRLFRYGLVPEAVLLTHGHLDHTVGCAALQREAGVKIYCGEGEDKFIFSEGNRSIFGQDVPKFEIERTLKDGEELEICGLKIKVIATPGHTAGGVSYLIGNNLFTGDTLFKSGVGRCDFPTGDEKTLIFSIKKLYALDSDYKVYCGHGLETTLDYERRNNPFVRA